MTHSKKPNILYADILYPQKYYSTIFVLHDSDGSFISFSLNAFVRNHKNIAKETVGKIIHLKLSTIKLYFLF